jgi:glucose-1-phosphate thymidylyltransferase
MELIGLLPAAGEANRISPLPCSKEIFPLGFRASDDKGRQPPKVACHYLLEKMRIAGISKAYVVLREGKWDIPAYFRDGSLVGMHLAYLMLGLPYGVPFTLDQAFPFVRDAVVVFGFPDILFKPEDAYVLMLDRLSNTGADAVLGLIPTRSPHKVDMVGTDNIGRVSQIVIRPSQTALQYTWVPAVWTPVMTQFIHDLLNSITRPDAEVPPALQQFARLELSMGNVFQAAVGAGLQVQTVVFDEGISLDIGTPEDLLLAIRDYERFM